MTNSIILLVLGQRASTSIVRLLSTKDAEESHEVRLACPSTGPFACCINATELVFAPSHGTHLFDKMLGQIQVQQDILANGRANETANQPQLLQFRSKCYAGDNDILGALSLMTKKTSVKQTSKNKLISK